MGQQTIEVLKQIFADGHTPSGSDYSDLIDSFWHKDLNLPLKQMAGLESEDLHVKNEKDTLLFSDKVFDTSSFSGLGRKYLRKNIVNGVNLLNQTAFADSNTVYHIQYDYDIGGGTITIPDGCVLCFDGGSVKNGTIKLNNTYIHGTLGAFDKTVILSGYLRNGNVDFEWFKNEKINPSDYDAFINGTTSDFGVKPNITDTNRIILTNLIANRFVVKFSSFIYGFDNEVVIKNAFELQGNGQDKTLLFCPNSSFLNMTSLTAAYPYLKDMTIEAWNSVLNIQSWTVNAVYGFEGRNSTFISYRDHAFKIDRSISGGTSAPMYASLFYRSSVSGGSGMSAFYELTSNSNIYNNIVDAYAYFNGKGIAAKGCQKTLFWNSNMLMYCNSNIAYGGLDYVFYADRLAPFYFVAWNNTFEGNTRSFKNIVRCENGNVELNMTDNRYFTPNFENNCAVYSLAPNTIIKNMDNGYLIYGSSIRNYSDKVLINITPKIDSGKTKYRIKVHSPYSSSQGTGSTSLLVPNAELADSLGISDLYTGNEANVSYFEISVPNIARNIAYLSLPKQTNNAGVNNIISKTQSALNCLSFGYKDIYYALHALPSTKVRSVNTKAEYDALVSSNFNNGILLIVNDIDLGGSTITLCSNITLLFLGGSMNNGVISLNTTSTILNYQGTAKVTGNNRLFGVSSSRPVSCLTPGYTYFDLSLNKPIWYTGTNWVDATGIVV